MKSNLLIVILLASNLVQINGFDLINKNDLIENSFNTKYSCDNGIEQYHYILQYCHDGIYSNLVGSLSSNFDFIKRHRDTYEKLASEFPNMNETIVIFDSGIDPNHEAFYNKSIIFKDFIGMSYLSLNDTYESPSDSNGHGTAIASVISGQPNINQNKIKFIEEFSLSHSEKFISNSIKITKSHQIKFDLEWPSNNSSNKVELFNEANELIYNYTNNINQNRINNSITVDKGNYYFEISNLNTEINSYKLKYQEDISFNSLDGIFPASKIIMLKIADDNGFVTTESVVNGINWVVENQLVYDINIVNMSFNFNQIDPFIDEYIEFYLINNGIVVVSSSGNNGIINSPASSPYVVSVAPSNENFSLPLYISNLSKPEVYNYGSNLIVASSQNEVYNNYYKIDSGSSFAAAMSTGAIAIVISILKTQGKWVNNINSVVNIRYIIKISSTHQYGYDRLNNSLQNENFQWGFLDMNALINMFVDIPLNRPQKLFSNNLATYNFQLRLEERRNYEINLFMPE
ncbi:MAG: S8 family serine peptidase, partial [Candidatus Heimdallarchaeota archaeon]|nr:S8 family serine peptidase [Candidatus Heimdallarchaeota archaeon]